MKAKYTLWLNNTITHNPISARRAWFWHVASHIYNECITFTIVHVKYPIYIYTDILNIYLHTAVT